MLMTKGWRIPERTGLARTLGKDTHADSESGWFVVERVNFTIPTP